MRHFILLLILASVVPSLLAKNPIPLRLVSFDPVIRKIGKYEGEPKGSGRLMPYR